MSVERERLRAACAMSCSPDAAMQTALTAVWREVLAVVEASDDPEFCEDHPDNCCEEWCAGCQASEAWWMCLARAHDDLDDALRRNREAAQ